MQRLQFKLPKPFRRNVEEEAVQQHTVVQEDKAVKKDEFNIEMNDAELTLERSNSVDNVASTQGSVDHEHNGFNFKNTITKYLKFVGPGLLVSVAYIDPGNYSTAVTSGAQNEFTLLCVVLLSNCLAVYLQCLCIKLASVTGLDLARACRVHLNSWVNIVLYVFGEACIISTDIAEVIGTAIALNILIKVPLPAGVAISVIDIFVIMFFYKPGFSSMRLIRYFEFAVALLVLAVFICFTIELSYIPFTIQQTRKIFRGFVPSREMFHHNGIYNAISILGATVMPHSLFLGSGIVQPRLLEYDLKSGHYSMDTESVYEYSYEENVKQTKEQMKENMYFNYTPSLKAIKYCMKFSMIELASTLLTVAFFINCAILIVAGATLYGTESAIGADLYTVHDLLSSTVSRGAGTIFMLALLLSGQSAGIVCTMAGQIVCEGHIKWNLVPWKRRLYTRCISIIPCLIISICLGKGALSQALNASQVVLSLLLPFIVAPLVYFTSSKSIMKLKVPIDDCDDDLNPNDTNEPEETNSNAMTHELQTQTSGLETVNTVQNADQSTEKFKNVDMSNGWINKIVSVIVWIFLTLLNVYAIVQLGLSHGDIS